jgi:SecD/SecF fusion protein
MQGKSFVRFFTIALVLVVSYIFLLMLPTARLERDATAYAEAKAKDIKDPEEREFVMEQAQEYFLDDSIADQGVLNLGFKSYTYEELKRGQLSLGLDLKGGMSVVLQVNLRDLVVTLAKESTDSIFRKAIDNARKAQNANQGDFVSLFGREYEKIAAGKPMARLFIASDKMKGITINSTNAQVLEAIRNEASSTVENTYNLLKKRIDKFGVVSPTVSLDKSSDRITVELPGIKSPRRARRLLQATANLEFWEMYRAVDMLGQQTPGPWIQLNDALKLNPKFNTKATEIVKPDSAALVRIEEIKADTSLSQVQKDSQIAVLDPSQANDTSDIGPLFTALSAVPPQDENDPFFGYSKSSDTASVMAMLNSEEARRIMPRDVRFVWGAQSEKDQTTGARLYQLFALNTRGAKKAPLSGDKITSTAVNTSQKGGMDYAVSIDMDKEGTRLWKKMTEDNVKRCVAVVLDDKVQSWPRVNEVIPNGRTQISGNFSATDANDLSNILSIGKLPATTEIIEESVVGPSLGQATINAGLMALLAGFILVIIFMLAYYSFGGILAVVTLLLNIFFIIGCLASFGTVLTLSGIAGIVLTIGMAVDANVIIFERIREELRKPEAIWKEAVLAGFKNSYSSIIDANVTTFITAVILFQFGLGPIKGFATVLAIGVISSVFTAVLVGRLLFDYYLTRNKPIAVWTGATKNVLANPNFDFISKRKIGYLISGILLVAGISSMATRGFELGVDFQGGRSYIVEFPKAVKVSELKSELSKVLEGGNSTVKTFGKSNQVKITTSYLQISEQESNTVDAIVLQKVSQACNTYSGTTVADSLFASGKPEGAQAGLYLLASSKVGPTIADDIRQSALLASVLALGFIFFYILVRFRRWQFSLGAIAALFHDVLIVMGLFSLLKGFTSFSLEIDQQFVAAILTIIGYSINDTVIVYDRIREEATLTPNEPLKNIVNRSLNSTLSRTSVTSLTTFLVVLILFLFGGDGISGFAFALFTGIIVGTYSSIFIAAPIVVDASKDASTFVRKEDDIDMRGEDVELATDETVLKDGE